MKPRHHSEWNTLLLKQMSTDVRQLQLIVLQLQELPTVNLFNAVQNVQAQIQELLKHETP